MEKQKKLFIGILLVIVLTLTSLNPTDLTPIYQMLTGQSVAVSLPDWYDQLPPYDGNPYKEVNHNVPFFTKEEITREPFEKYSSLDRFGRCGVAYANLCDELMPTEDRGDISNVHPSGWVQNKINGQYVWQRCHLIGFALAGENDNEKNLVTGCKDFNVKGMLPFEITVRDYLNDHPGKHVLYRVTPVYEGDELVCRGVLMEAASVEDHGYEVCFNVFVYNATDDFAINYSTGETREYPAR